MRTLLKMIGKAILIGFCAIMVLFIILTMGAILLATGATFVAAARGGDSVAIIIGLTFLTEILVAYVMFARIGILPKCLMGPMNRFDQSFHDYAMRDFEPDLLRHGMSPKRARQITSRKK